MYWIVPILATHMQGLCTAILKKLTYSFAALFAMYLLLLIPPQQNEMSKQKPFEIPFVWRQDELWQ
jgi:hypothetical protein